MDVGTRASALAGLTETDIRIRGAKMNGNGESAPGLKGWGTVYGVGNGSSNWELEKNGSGKEHDAEVKDNGAVKHYDADGTHSIHNIYTFVG